MEGTAAPVGPRKPRTEYISGILMEWAKHKGIAPAHIQQRYIRAVRHAWLDLHIFETIVEVQQIATEWL